jgi:hypothetical protein
MLRAYLQVRLPWEVWFKIWGKAVRGWGLGTLQHRERKLQDHCPHIPFFTPKASFSLSVAQAPVSRLTILTWASTRTGHGQAYGGRQSCAAGRHATSRHGQVNTIFFALLFTHDNLTRGAFLLVITTGACSTIKHPLPFFNLTRSVSTSNYRYYRCLQYNGRACRQGLRHTWCWPAVATRCVSHTSDSHASVFAPNRTLPVPVLYQACRGLM